MLSSIVLLLFLQEIRADQTELPVKLEQSNQNLLNKEFQIKPTEDAINERKGDPTLSKKIHGSCNKLTTDDCLERWVRNLCPGLCPEDIGCVEYCSGNRYCKGFFQFQSTSVFQPNYYQCACKPNWDGQNCDNRIDSLFCKFLTQQYCLEESVKPLCPKMCSSAGRLTIDGAECIFPFVFFDRTYTDCAAGVHGGDPWCATSVHEVTRRYKTYGTCAPIKITCAPKCVNGNCTGNNKCSCFKGWTGELCDEPKCAPKCLYGTCKGPDLCKCERRWIGDICDKPVCDDGCVNGSCVGQNQCSCITGWTGNTCDIRTCDESDGFFSLPGSNQCFKPDVDHAINWLTAESTCRAYGLELAEPDPDILLKLQKYLNKYFNGGKYYWVNGRGDDSNNIKWNRQGSYLNQSSKLWSSGFPTKKKFSASYCLMLDAYDSVIKSSPGRPYQNKECTYASPYPLCERI